MPPPRDHQKPQQRQQPTRPQETRGNRSGLAFSSRSNLPRNADGLEADDTYFDQVKDSPPSDGSVQASFATTVTKNPPSARDLAKASLRNRKMLRFSLPKTQREVTDSTDDVTDDGSMTELSERSDNGTGVGKLKKLFVDQSISPSDLSMVSTAPPSTGRKPATNKKNDTILDDSEEEEVYTAHQPASPETRLPSPFEEKMTAVLSPVTSARSTRSKVPLPDPPTQEHSLNYSEAGAEDDGGNDVNEDLLPPPPPDEDENDSPIVTSLPSESSHKSKTGAATFATQPEATDRDKVEPSPEDQNNGNFHIGDDYDDDNEGEGFVLHAATPPSSRSRKSTPRIRTPPSEADTPLLESGYKNRSISSPLAQPLRKSESSKARKDKDLLLSKDRGVLDRNKRRTSADMRRKAAMQKDRNALDKTSNRVSERKRSRAVDAKSSSPESSSPPIRIAKRKKTTRVSTFSPTGIAVANRTYEAVPVSDYKDKTVHSSNGKDNVRKSKRARVKPLDFWRNERFLYGPNDFSEEDGYVGVLSMPVPLAVSKAQPTPYKKRKTIATNKKKTGIKSKLLDATLASTKSQMAETEPFDTTKLRRKHEYIDGDQAHMWDDNAEVATTMKVVSYKDEMDPRDLPLSKDRTKSEGRVVGNAAQAFNVSNESSTSYAGYIVGNLSLPPKGIKDAESVGTCVQIFTVVSCQPDAFEIAYADPDVERDGMLNPERAQRFLLGPGDMFRIPPGNCYRLQNHSRQVEAFLTWTIVRPMLDGESSA